LRDLITQGTVFENLVVEQNYPNLGRRRLAVNGRRLEAKAGSEALILLAIEETPLHEA
jgi:hypothetical protein